jgi:hypothetical protein
MLHAHAGEPGVDPTDEEGTVASAASGGDPDRGIVS